MDRSSKQKINKETQVLNDTLDEMAHLRSLITYMKYLEISWLQRLNAEMVDIEICEISSSDMQHD